MGLSGSPTPRELEILKILWQRQHATVREVYEEMRDRTTIAQNTVQAFLRNMEEKGLVGHETRGRSFVYFPLQQMEQTRRHLIGRLLDRVYDGAVDQLVASLLSVREPTHSELCQLEALIARTKAAGESATTEEPLDDESR